MKQTKSCGVYLQSSSVTKSTDIGAWVPKVYSLTLFSSQLCDQRQVTQ